MSLLKYSAGNLPPLERSNGRIIWADIARGISICLVVYWHAVSDNLALNEALIFLRMPLFFFAAGLFIRPAFAPGNENLALKRILNFLYLYVLWAMILFSLIYIPRNLINGDWPFKGFSELLTIFADPPTTLWFIYALCLAVIATVLARRVPLWILLGTAVCGYLWSASGGHFRDPTFIDRCLRLYPFFLLGLISFPALDALGKRLRYYGLPMLAAFCVLALTIYFSAFRGDAIVTFTASLFGIISLVCAARAIERNAIGRLLAWLGASSLYIYLMHRIVLGIGTELFKLTGAEKSHPAGILFMSLVAVIAVGACAWTGPVIERKRGSAFLFALPWRALRTRPARAV